jgi:hypothetical protein
MGPFHGGAVLRVIEVRVNAEMSIKASEKQRLENEVIYYLILFVRERANPGKLASSSGEAP